MHVSNALSRARTKIKTDAPDKFCLPVAFRPVDEYLVNGCARDELAESTRAPTYRTFFEHIANHIDSEGVADADVTALDSEAKWAFTVQPRPRETEHECPGAAALGSGREDFAWRSLKARLSDVFLALTEGVARRREGCSLDEREQDATDLDRAGRRRGCKHEG